MLHENGLAQSFAVEGVSLSTVPLLDVLDFLVLPDKSLNLGYSRQTHGLTGSAGPAWDVVDMTPDAEGYMKRYRLKTSKGWPWDVSRFSNDIVLDWRTEQDWTSPNDYKQHVANYFDTTINKYVDGVAMFPRWVRGDYNYIPKSTVAAQTEFRIFINCTWDGQHHFLKDILQVLSGPVVIDHGGTIGMQPTLIHEYYWGGTNGIYTSKEENLYAYRYGWMRWSYSTLNSSGQYVIQNMSSRNQLYAVAPPAVVFPCGG